MARKTRLAHRPAMPSNRRGGDARNHGNDGYSARWPSSSAEAMTSSRTSMAAWSRRAAGVIRGRERKPARAGRLRDAIQCSTRICQETLDRLPRASSHKSTTPCTAANGARIRMRQIAHHRRCNNSGTAGSNWPEKIKQNMAPTGSVLRSQNRAIAAAARSARAGWWPDRAPRSSGWTRRSAATPR